MVPTRRDALKQIAAAGIGCAVSPGAVWGQDSSITIAGRPVQIAIASVSPSTVRITISPLVSGVAQNLRPSGALVEAAAGRGVGSWRAPFRLARAGDLSVQFVPGRLRLPHHRKRCCARSGQAVDRDRNEARRARATI